MNKMKSAITAVAIVATAGGLALVGAGGAAAQGTATPWAPGGVSQDDNAVGGIEFFDASGNQITSGSTNAAPFAAYAVGLGVPRAGDTKASLFLFEPQFGVTPDGWTGNQVGLASTFPNSAAPAPVSATTLPVNTGATNNSTLDSMISTLPATSTQPGYANVYEIRMFTGAPGKPTTATYDYADISINSTAHTWQLVWSPDQSGTATTSTLTTSADPGDAVNQGSTVTLTDTIAPAGAAGTVQFQDGSTDIGSPVTVSGGVATTTAVLATAGAHPISAVFTPAALSSFGSSTSNTVTINAAHVLSNTSVALAANPTTGPAFSAVTLTATPTPAIAGQVKFFDAGAQIGVANTTGGPASITYSGFAQGDHNNITASFTPTDTTDYNASTSAAVDFNATAPTGAAPDQQSITADVAPGALSITTPYTSSNPLDVGTLALNAQGTQLSGSAQFGDGTTQAGSIEVVDTRAGNANWTASASSSDLTDSHGDSINQQNVGLTGLHGLFTPGNAIQALSFTDNPAASPAVAPGAAGNAGLGGGAHAFAATTAGGDGTVGIYGTLTITAPTSTVAGHYTGTITFTVA